MREERKLRESIEFSRYKVASWFNRQKGKNYRPTSLPYLSDNYKADMVTWVREMNKIVVEEKTLVCFLDEK